ncbi:pseudoazurin [Thioclava sp. F28-4]|uniref:pseudoazurin n=1 Tax=Thioclava sp. F28-4 TaxID=1915315 RepID=UPI0009961A42|nr:pseudoazurin [Thioclava sp. F28-4]OOY04863.1 pseudoazurin [Thioclava sp. F28-4]
MIRTLISGLAMTALLSGAASAETHEVHMLNKGEKGVMVFEPALVKAAPGDTIRFIPTDKGHNAESIDGMIPDGAEGFAGKVNKEVEVTLDTEGLYAVRCKPHYAMGMVMVIAVGDATTPDNFFEGRVPKKAKERFEEELGAL